MKPFFADEGTQTACWLPGWWWGRSGILSGGSPGMNQSTQHKTAVAFSPLSADKILLLLRNSRDIRFLYLSFQEDSPSHCQCQTECLLGGWIRFVIGSSRIHVCLKTIFPSLDFRPRTTQSIALARSFRFGPVIGQTPTCFIVIIIIRHAGNSDGRLQVLVKTSQPHGCTALLFGRATKVFGRLVSCLAFPNTGGQRFICAHPIAGR
jgi:hypothetical protein